MKRTNFIALGQAHYTFYTKEKVCMQRVNNFEVECGRIGNYFYFGKEDTAHCIEIYCVRIIRFRFKYFC